MVRSKAGKNRAARVKLPEINMHDSNQQKLLQHKTSRCVSVIIKPLRIFQFVRIRNLIISFNCLNEIINIRKISEWIIFRAIKFSSSRQFAVLLVFAFTIYMIVMDPMPISALACILLIVLSGVYVFVLAVELISHFAGGALHVIPVIYDALCALLFSEIRVT
ncbi:uncharacterized protein LOC112455787 [Temnothorax curvispinosus]|uniref:Uncharacterized protein LOC112455787 n=1 Tax=Temnothorax curvispinosus TaxID=300111 RepID=A0A6J1PY89_9HYME|nr:uncharacterized protein LOC112455787 [Temnothorax curvispinosus]